MERTLISKCKAEIRALRSHLAVAAHRNIILSVSKPSASDLVVQSEAQGLHIRSIAHFAPAISLAGACVSVTRIPTLAKVAARTLREINICNYVREHVMH